MKQNRVYEYLLDNSSSENLLLICRDDREAKKICDVATFLNYKSFALPDLRVSYGDDLRPFQPEIYGLLESLYNYFNTAGKKLLISPIRTLLLPLPKGELFPSIKLEFASTLNLKQLQEKLFYWGYHFVDIVTGRGEIALRGNIFDIFPINSKTPYRISLLGSEIESIREFEIDTQKSRLDEFESLEIAPAMLGLSQSEYRAWEERVTLSEFDTFVKDIDSLGLWCLDKLGVDYLTKFNPILTSNMGEELSEIYSLDTPIIPQDSFKNLSTIPKAKLFRELKVENLNGIIDSNPYKEVTIIAKNRSIVRSSPLKSFEGLNFVYKDVILNLISDTELIISLNKESGGIRVKRTSIILDELNIGDFVVHETYGIGLFKGVVKRKILGATREFVVIEYQNEDMLLTPIENLNLIDRYIVDSGTLPTLDKMGRGGFKRTKGKVREKLFQIASEIINISAQRELKRGIKLQITPLEHQKFLEKAGFIHTPDQIETIREMLKNMGSGKIMDRLLSADVGFGKTEVAMNGMFVTWKNGYQAMIVVPTTLLSLQHFKSMQERFRDYDINIAKLDRFTTPKAKRGILEGLESGKIDMVVGTHALLKAKFKNLAFIVIDEEHKFGVKQKEALKQMASDVHLLSMSATPIPRTLNMALSNLKSFSEILTPPTERARVRTFVKNYNEKIVKEAIVRELRRGGGVFYIFNSIAQIEEKRKVLEELIPNLRITVLHSKVSTAKSEKDMVLFENGEYDIILSTSIVESGIHIPRANTIIVDGADRFGIADLHQLRGRVGRGGKEGYCYFMVEDKEQLNESAKKRLLALESHSKLGSGAILAFHDLEIRGGGNIIGEAQSGHIKQIGYSLYIKMLEKTIRELSGKSKTQDMEVDIRLSIDAYLSEELISEARLRLELYRRLSLCKRVDEVYEIEAEIADRFGDLDTISRQFIDIIIMKILARERGIVKIANSGEKIFIEFSNNQPRVILKAYSRDDDDLIETSLKYLKENI